jgi:DNA-binding XRE family transcriptional regulator
MCERAEAQVEPETRRFGDRANLRHSAGVPEARDSRRPPPAARPKPQHDPRRRALGEAIKEARIARQCSSQARLAEAAGVSERSVAGAEAGEYVGRKILAALEAVFGWPTHKTTDYLRGDDDALKELPAQGPPVMNAASKQLADLGMRMDVVPDPGSLAWLRDLRTKLPLDQFIEVVLQMTRPLDD